MKLSRTDERSQSWRQSVNCDGRAGWVLLMAAALVLVPAALGESGRMWLRYDRQGLEQGQLWRLFSAHVVHLNWQHALLNAAALCLLWVLFAAEYPARRWLWIIGGALVVIDAGLWFLRPQVEWYVGASGILHGVLAAGALAGYRKRRESGALLMLLLVIKLVYEQRTGLSAFDSALPILPDAHLFGVLGGLLGAWLPRDRANSL